MSQARANRKIAIMTLVVERQGWLENHRVFLRYCMKYRKELQDCIDVLEGRANFEGRP